MRMQQYMRIWAIAGAVVAAGACGARSARAAYVDPSFFGQPGSTYQAWTSFTTVSGQNAANASTNSAGVATYTDRTAATDGAFLTGGHIYSFSGVVNPQITVPVTNAGTDALYTVVLQTEVLGNPLSTASFSLTSNGSTTAATSVVQTDLGSSGSGFGGGSYGYVATWSGLSLSNATSLVLNYAASDLSSSQLSARVDTFATAAAAVPEPASAALVAAGAVGTLVRRRRRAARV